MKPEFRITGSTLAVAFVLAFAADFASAQFTLPTVSGRQLMQGATPFELRSFAYSPTPIGLDPTAGATGATSDTRLIQRDGPQIVAAGGNAVRIYGGMVLNPDGTSQGFGATQTWIQEAANQGLWVAFGTFIPPSSDFSNATVRSNIVNAHVNMAATFKNEPNILMWIPGNEVNLSTGQLNDYYTLMDEVAQAIHVEQGGGAGPGFGPYVCIVDGDGGLGIAGGDALAPNVDIWGANVFRGSNFGSLFADAAANTTDPFWVAEFGIDSWCNDGGFEDRLAQADFLQTLWWHLSANSATAFGGDIAFYSDEWWKSTIGGDPATPGVQDFGGNAFGAGPDNFINEEWLGVMAIADNPTAGEPDLVSPKLGHGRIQDIWVNGLSGPAPFRAFFDANVRNNYGGAAFGFYGGGLPNFQNDGAVALAVDAAGDSGAPGDNALHATGSLPAGANFTFFGVVLPLSINQFGYDFSAMQTIEFKIKLGSPTAHAAWGVRLEDAVPTGAGDFDNKTLALPTLTTSFQTVQFNLSEFTSGGGQVVDPSNLMQIVFNADTSAASDPFELDLIVDDVIVTAPGQPVPVELSQFDVE